MATLPRSSDSRVRITILGADGNPITISGLADLNIYCYQKAKEPIQSWNKVAGEIETITDAAGLVEVLLNRENTALLKFNPDNKKFFFEVECIFTDADFEDGVRVEIDTNIVPTFSNGVTSEEVTAEDSQTAYQ